MDGSRSKSAKAAKRNLAEGDDESQASIMNKRMFDELRKQTLDETISQAGSDEDEVIPVDPPAEVDAELVAADGEGDGAGNREANGSGGGADEYEVDELALLLADTPQKRLKSKLREADKLTKAGDLWGALQLRQEVLGLARMCCGPYRGGDRKRHPMLLASAHWKLAKAYAVLECYPQTAEHCSCAIEALPVHGHYHEKVATFKKEVNILLGETLLQCKPPKPLIALQHFQAVSDMQDGEGEPEPDLGMQVMVAQCYALLGNAKLLEAKATREARAQLEARLEALQTKLAGLDRKSTERQGLQQKIEDTSSELDEESNFELRLLGEAHEEIEKAVDKLMEVNASEADRLREIFPEKYKSHPLLAALFSRSSEMLLKMAEIEGQRGDTTQQLNNLENIMSIHRDYGFLPLGLVARTLKEQGAVFVVQRKYDEALRVYNEFLALQQERYQEEDVAKLGVAQAEAFKLIGNVYVAKKFYRRALEHYEQALQLFGKFLGTRSNLALDLEHRIQEIRSAYMEEP